MSDEELSGCHTLLHGEVSETEATEPGGAENNVATQGTEIAHFSKAIGDHPALEVIEL